MYQYDVFISYRRTSVSRNWVQLYFAPKLKEYLEELLPDPPHVFVDERSVEPGDIWQATISQALQRSKCLVAVLNAPYFFSQYCRAEWASFLRREELLASAGRLIRPIQFFDGEHFDPSALDRQMIDMRPWATSAPAFQETREYMNFELAVRHLAESLTRPDGPIRNPAAYQAWPVVQPAASAPMVPVPQPKLGA